MPFVASLRERLKDLKTEFDEGFMPLSAYEDLCRQAIAEYGPGAFLSQGSIDNV